MREYESYLDDEKIETEGGSIYDSADLSTHGLERVSYCAGYLDGYHSAFEDAWRHHKPWYMKDRFGWPIEFVEGRSKLYRIARILWINLSKFI